MANSIKIGGFSFDALKIGGSDVDAAYLGDTLVYSGGTTHDYSLDYFTIVSLSNNNAISFQNSAYKTTVTISYSTDNGHTWTDATASQNKTVSLATLNTNDRMLVKGTNNTLGVGYNKFTRFNATGDFNVEGNTMSLLYGDNFSGQTTLVSGNSTWFPMLFSYNTHIINAENLVLPATDLLSPKPTGTMGAYNGMFRGCSNLLTAPQLPAMTLNASCYSSMFEGCTSLRVAPTLPATTLANNCYQKMFCIDRTNPKQAAMTVAPELPATTLANKCYTEMFLNNASLTTAPSSIGDSSTTMATSACTYMFSGCTSLTTAPELPATTLASGCYNNMFRDCTSLTTAPELPATTLASGCYNNMFNYCTSLTTAPELPATTLVNYCYQNMFGHCTSLTTAPVLSATTLVSGCYNSMFNGCTSLTTAPTLPATTLVSSCYNSMFYGCTSLTTAPELPATTLAYYCYNSMFSGCTSLNRITCLATDISASDCTSNWVNGVAASGTFVKAPSMNDWTTGTNGIPSGWTVEDVPVLQWVSISSGSTIPQGNIYGVKINSQDAGGDFGNGFEIGTDSDNCAWFGGGTPTRAPQFTAYFYTIANGVSTLENSWDDGVKEFIFSDYSGASYYYEDGTKTAPYDIQLYMYI